MLCMRQAEDSEMLLLGWGEKRSKAGEGREKKHTEVSFSVAELSWMGSW